MTERVLTDQEVGVVLLKWSAEGRTPPYFQMARAVEAAVLAKVDLGSLRAKVVADIANRESRVTEREARRRERAAYCHGWREARQTATMWRMDTLDERYPLPKCDKCGQELP